MCYSSLLKDNLLTLAKSFLQGKMKKALKSGSHLVKDDFMPSLTVREIHELSEEYPDLRRIEDILKKIPQKVSAQSALKKY